MPEIEVHKSYRVVRQNDCLQVIRLENNLAVFKIQETQILEKKKGRPKFKAGGAQPRQGIVTDKQLKDYLSGKCGIFGGDFSLITLEVLEGLRHRGWSYGQEERLEWILPDPFDVISSGQDSIVVKFQHDCHLLSDSAGKVLPVGIWFDYISAKMDNKNYDLGKAAAILKKNPNIEFTYDDPGSGGVYGEPPDPIRRIPYYNAGPASSFLGFWWAPPVDQYRHMWDKCVNFGGQYPSTNMERAIWELDLLGLREGGAAIYDDFYGEDSSNNEDDEEDDY